MTLTEKIQTALYADPDISSSELARQLCAKRGAVSGIRSRLRAREREVEVEAVREKAKVRRQIEKAIRYQDVILKG